MVRVHPDRPAGNAGSRHSNELRRKSKRDSRRDAKREPKQGNRGLAILFIENRIKEKEELTNR